jgi:hypothetical protein
MLSVTGIESRNDVRLIKKYANFCLSKFCSKSVLKKSNIEIKFLHVDDLESKQDKKDLKEHNAWMEYFGIINCKKDFVITLDKSVINKRAKKQIIQFKNTLTHLGHELVHVKQYLLNELFDYSDGHTVRYMGSKYTYTGDTDWTYWDQLFEIEAYGRQEGLYQMFKALTKDEEK